MKKRKFQNRIISELLNNCEKRTPICSHFLACGGCSYQDFGHEDQMEVKKSKLGELFGDMVSKINVTFHGECEYGYRTRMDYIVSEQGFGLRRKRSFDQVVDLSECYLIDNRIFQFLRLVFEEGIKLGLKPYDLKTHEGFWRYLSVRINEKNDFMLIFNTTGDVDSISVLEELVGKITNDELRITNEPVETLHATSNAGDDPGNLINNNCVKKPPELVSVYHLINPSITDDNFGSIRKYWQDQYLKYDINGVNISIGPNTFFQNNIPLLNKLISKILTYIDPKDQVLDLYCGVGTLSLPIAQKAQDVLGVELMEESIQMAQSNAEYNKIRNVKFVVGDVGEFLNSKTPISVEDKIKISNFITLVLDPPRKGLEKSAEKLLECDFEKIIYMSCNPLSLKRDLEVLLKNYQIVEMSWWDLYPQTPHVEGIVYLKKITNY